MAEIGARAVPENACGCLHLRAPQFSGGVQIARLLTSRSRQLDVQRGKGLGRDHKMQTPLNAQASNAGAIFSNNTFEVPQFQREYSWADDEVEEFWSDLSSSIDLESYFLGLIILTDEGGKKHVVDGQQRIITVTLLAAALYHEAMGRGRRALADKVRSDFLYAIDYDSDESKPRVTLSDGADNETLQSILRDGFGPGALLDNDSVSLQITKSFEYLRQELAKDLSPDPFKRMGKWTEFLTHKLYFAVFIHPDASSAYQVYEVINTRGKELTTADLLKNYILSQTPHQERQSRYDSWQTLSRNFPPDSANTFVQFIRHAVTVESGYVLPKDLFSFIAERKEFKLKTLGRRNPPRTDELMQILERSIPTYSQIMDPTLPGPSDARSLKVFAALNSVNVITVRPLLLAMSDVPNSAEGMEFVLRLVIRRIVVGSLGTGNVDRMFGEAARRVQRSGDWTSAVDDLGELIPSRDDFVERLRKRSLNKNVLTFLRRSIIQRSITPEMDGVLHYIWTKQAAVGSLNEEQGARWGGTLGNTVITDLARRPPEAADWASFKRSVLPHAIEGEVSDQLERINQWDAETVEQLGLQLAESAARVWYE
jgi:hypothetical protein